MQGQCRNGQGGVERVRRTRYVDVLSSVFRDTPFLPVDAIASLYCSYVLPRQDDGTSQIQVNWRFYRSEWSPCMIYQTAQPFSLCFRSQRICVVHVKESVADLGFATNATAVVSVASSAGVTGYGARSSLTQSSTAWRRGSGALRKDYPKLQR